MAADVGEERVAPSRPFVGRPAPVAVLSNCPWHSQWRRRQQVAARLTVRRAVYFLDPPFPALDFARGRVKLGSWLATPLAIEADPSGVRIVRGAAGIPAQRFSGTIRRANGWLQRAWARRCLARVRALEGGVAPILICYEPLLHPLADLGGARATVYEAADDYAAYARSRRLSPILRERMAALAAACDLTVAANAALGERLRPGARRLELLPHGVDTELFHPGAHRGTRFERRAASPAVRAVYHGTLNHLIDLDLLAALLRAGIELDLAGQCAWDRRAIARLRAAGAVHLHGLLSQGEAAALVAAADVGILPYRRLPGVECAEPLKRLEFFAAGLPAVATDFSAPNPPADGIRVARTTEEFVAAVRAGRELPPDARAQLRARAQHQTWKDQVARLEGWLAELELARPAD